MNRFPSIPENIWSDEQREVAANISNGPRGKVRGPFLAMMHSPHFAAQVEKLGEYLRFNSPLPNDLAEFAILMTGHRWQVARILYSHAALGLKAGLTQKLVDDLVSGHKPTNMTPSQTTIYQFCSELLRDQKVSDQSFEKAVSTWGRPAVMDLIGTCGYYTMLGMVLNVAQIAGGPDIP